ncbi:MAG: metallophosphoesterase [Actinomycetota bacterium]
MTARPTSDRPAELGFIRKPMVQWFSPRELTDTALRVVISGIFGAYSDKREIQAALPASPPFDYSDRSELWLDYVADLGDGFGPTYSVASLLAEEKLEVGSGSRSWPTQRGKLLVMGGDQVYPAATIRNYENRLVGPYRAALPMTASDHPHLFAVPGNHDWYDGLTTFMRVFCQQNWIGGWLTQQSRSYFAAKLPRGWWLWAIDIQFDDYIDQPQLTYFSEKVAPAVRPGDSIVLCSAKPSWVHANRSAPEAFVNLDYFERKVVRPTGASIRLSLSGDAHHYARYESTGGAHKITSGGGGAYLSATHRLPKELELPPDESRAPGKTTPPAHYELAARYPGRKESRHLKARVFALPVKNYGFWILMGVVHALFAFTVAASLREEGEDFVAAMTDLGVGDVLRGLRRSPLAIVLALVLMRGLVGLTKNKKAKGYAAGLLHGIAHLLVIAATIAAASQVFADLSGAAFRVSFVVSVGVIGGLLGSLVMAAYLYLADAAGLNTNELFSAHRNEHFKNFLRLRVDEDGTLTVYPIAVPRTTDKWTLSSSGDEGDPWFQPPEPIAVRLIEEPIRIEPSA